MAGGQSGASDASSSRSTKRDVAETFQPGRIVWLVDAEQGPNGERSYRLTPASRGDFRRISVTQRMMADHLPLSYLEALRSCCGRK